MANMGSSARGSNLHAGSDPAGRAYLDTYEQDKRSIFVGNLPTEITGEKLSQEFEGFGPIQCIALHKGDSVVDGITP